jgi:uncharacterized membrane protein
MQFILRILALLLICIILLFFVIGFTNEPITEFTHTKVITSPNPVVWQALTNPNQLSEWMQEVRHVAGPSQAEENSIYCFYLYDYDKNAYHEEKIDVYKPENKISFVRVESKSRPLLRDYLRLYELKQLRDGTTEIKFKLSYRCNSFLTIVYDKLLLNQRIKNRAVSNLENLKKMLEKV